MATDKQQPSSVGNGHKVQKAGRAQPMAPWDEMDRLFEGFMPRGWMRPFRWEWPSMGEAPFSGGKFPRVDIVDRDDEIVVRAEVPGVEKKDLDVSLTDNTVCIKGATRREEKEEKGEYLRSELVSGSFSRTLALPGAVDSARAKATFKDGVLELVLPKIEESKRQSIRVE